MSGRSHTLVVQAKKSDPRNAGLLIDAHALGLNRVTDIQVQDLYFIEGELAEPDLKRLAAELLSDPVAQTAEWRSAGSDTKLNGQVIETARRPGVTDSVAEQIVRAAHELGIAPVRRAATGNSYCVGGRLTTDDLRTLAERLLANSVIQLYKLGPIEPTFPRTAEASAQVDLVPLRELDGDGLLALSRSFAKLIAPDGITMNCVSPGFIDSGSAPKEELDRMVKLIPAGYVGSVDDAVAAVRYLLSEEARYVNGANIQLSGAWGV